MKSRICLAACLCLMGISAAAAQDAPARAAGALPRPAATAHSGQDLRLRQLLREEVALLRTINAGGLTADQERAARTRSEQMAQEIDVLEAALRPAPATTAIAATAGRARLADARLPAVE